MKITKKLLESIISRVTSSVNRMNYSKLQLAKDLAWAQNVINWYYTDYKSWTKFCRAHIPLASSTISMYIYIANTVDRYGYTDAECEEMINALGWTRFKLGLVDSNRKLTPKGFIKKYKHFCTTAGGTATKDGDRAYTFSLPKRQADIFDSVLTAYGMVTTESGRKNVRSAMIKLVNRKLK